MVSATDRWDWTADASVSPTRLGDHAASRYRRFRRVMEAVERVDGTSFGMLLAVESARDELRPFEEVTWLVRLAGTRDELRQVQHLHRVLDAAVTQLPEEEGGGKWVDELFDERDARVKWYQQWLEAGDFEDEITLEPRQEEVLTLLKAAVEAYDPDSATEILMADEAAVMQLAFEKVTWSTNVLMLSTPDWLVSPLAVGSSFGFSRWGSQRLILKHDDPDPSASVVMAAAVWSRLNHPHVVKFLGACHVGERPFVIHEIAQPLVQNLKDRKDRKESIPPAFLWRLIHEIALALYYIHQSGFAVKILTPDVLCLAPYQDRALLECMNAVPLDSEDAPLNTEAFATCIVDLWRELDTSEQGVGALADPKRIRRIGNRGEFPVECPDFFMESEWKVLKQMYNSCTDMEFRDVIESLSSLANLTNRERLFAKWHIDPRSPYTSKSWQSLSSAEGNSKLKSTAASLLNSTGGAEQREMPSWTISADTVQLEEKIGRGSFAVVYTGKWFDSPVVVKCLRPRGGILSVEERETFHREADIWFSLSHINIVQMFGAYEFEGSCHIVCAYANAGTLDKYLASEDRSKAYSRALKKLITAVDRTDVWERLLEAALGLQYLHRTGIVHGDLKLNNILVGSGLSKLTDFGLSLRARDDNSSRGGALGAYQWKAPECISFSGKSGSPATFASDVYSFAMCIVEAVTGEPPWKQVTSVDEVAKYHIMHGKALPRPADMLDAEWALIKQMTDSEPERRLTMDSVVAHLYAKVVGQSMDQLDSSEHEVSEDVNHVLARPQALLALSSLAKSNNRSITINCGNLLSMVQHYRYYSPAEQQEISAVVTLLQDERSDVVEWATKAVGHLASLSKANRSMIRDVGGVSQIVRLLKKSYASSPYQTDVALYAAAALRNLAHNADCRIEISKAGGIPQLTALLKCGTEPQKEKAPRALRNLSLSAANGAAFSGSGSIDALASLVRNGSNFLRDEGTKTLIALSQYADTAQIIADKCIPLLTELLRDGSAEQRKSAVDVLYHLSVREKYYSALSLVLKPLLGLVHSDIQIEAVGTVANLARNAEGARVITENGGIQLLTTLLRDEPLSDKISVLVALVNLTVTMPNDTAEGIVLGGTIPLLVQLMERGSERDFARRIIQCVLEVCASPDATRMTGTIPSLVSLTNDKNPRVRELAVAGLANLTSFGDAVHATRVAEAGGIGALSALLREKASSSELSNAVAVVVNLSTRSELKPAIRDYDVFGLLQECGEQSMAQSLAILAWQNLAENYMNSATVVMMDSRDYKYFKYSYSWEVRKPE